MKSGRQERSWGLTGHCTNLIFYSEGSGEPFTILWEMEEVHCSTLFFHYGSYSYKKIIILHIYTLFYYFSQRFKFFLRAVCHLLWFVNFGCELISMDFVSMDFDSPYALAHKSIRIEGLCVYYCWILLQLLSQTIFFVTFLPENSYTFQVGKSSPRLQV